MDDILKRPAIIYFTAAVISVCLTAVTIYHYPVFNLDGVLYLRVADTYLQNGLYAAAKIYNWPFYSVLIAWTSKLTTLSLLNSAYVLNFIFFTIIPLVFIKVIAEIDSSPKMLWLALIVILVWHSLSSYRADLIRDSGYWGCYLFSIWCLLRFFKTNNWMAAAGWSVAIIAGTLFRIEGAVFLVLVPFLVWFLFEWSWYRRFKAFIKLNIFLGLLVFVGFLGYFYLHGKDFYHHLGRLSELANVSLLYLQKIPQLFNTSLLKLKDSVLTPISADSAESILFFRLIGAYIFNVVKIISVGYLIPSLYAVSYKPLFNGAQSVLKGYFAINLLITALFFSSHFFVSGRYLVPMAFIAVCYVPFGLRGLYRKWKENVKLFSLNNVVLFIVFVLMLSMVAANVHRFGHSKLYIYRSGNWLKQHTDKNAILYTNYSKLIFLSGRKTSGWDETKSDYFTFNKIYRKPWRKYDYLVLHINKQQQNELSRITKIIRKQPIKVFKNNKSGDKVVIFKILP